MKLAITRFVIVAAIAVLMVAVGSTAAWAQTPPCPSSPSYSPDFSSNQSCLTPNDNASPFPILFDGNNVLQLTSSTSNQIGAAWYNTPQPVENGFTTSFQFQFTGASTPPADGIAFVIQNSTSKLNAIGFTGGNGGAIGYGDDDNNLNPSTGGGIPNSLAIEFDTYENAWDPGPNTNGSVSHVAIQSCGTGRNTSHHGYACSPDGLNSTVGAPVVTANMADGTVHSVTITYVAAVPGALANIQVTLDGANVFSSPVTTDLSAIGLGTGGTAYVGFTGATGGDYENQYILNWVFTTTVQGTPITPSTLAQTVSVTVPDNTLTAGFSFSNVPATDLSVATGTIPYFGFSGMTQPQYAALVAGTALGGTTCLT
ncbi:MAG: L-type lectin-domain containing protein, partial [Candidatus Sulfotelmatobacter sp.]